VARPLLLLVLCLAACGGGRALPVTADAAPTQERAKPALPLPEPEDSAAWTRPHWQCETRPDGRHLCRKVWPDDGLPPGGSGWTCHLATVPPPVPCKENCGARTWFCHGDASKAPGGAGWSCRQVQSGTWRCEKPDTVGDDRPPDAGSWACVKGTVYGGSLCEKVEFIDWRSWLTSPCHAGQRVWCDGLVTAGWGQAECDAQTGQWKTVTVNGMTMLDCREDLADGRRPHTLCACYHFFFNPECCEREDCVVPDETVGQLCPDSPGKLCDFCNPLEQTCVETNAKCIVTNAHETVCGQGCASTPCPAGFDCLDVKLKTGATKQCVPSDLSCYY
jgi:hypothetical protein